MVKESEKNLLNLLKKPPYIFSIAEISKNIDRTANTIIGFLHNLRPYGVRKIKIPLKLMRKEYRKDLNANNILIYHQDYGKDAGIYLSQKYSEAYSWNSTVHHLRNIKQSHPELYKGIRMNNLTELESKMLEVLSEHDNLSVCEAEGLMNTSRTSVNRVTDNLQKLEIIRKTVYDDGFYTIKLSDIIKNSEVTYPGQTSS